MRADIVALHQAAICTHQGADQYRRGGNGDVEGAHVRVVLDTDQPLAPVLLERLLAYRG